MAAASRALLCRGGVEQMRADADLAARKFAEAGVVRPIPGPCRGWRAFCPVTLTAVTPSSRRPSRAGRDVGAPDVLATILAERALIAMARDQWDQAEDFADRPATCSGSGRRCPRVRGASPGGLAPERCRGGAASACRGSARASAAYLRAAPLGRSGPDRARPCPAGPRRPRRGQDQDARDR